MEKALKASSSTDSVDTLGELFLVAFDDIWTGIANPISEAPTGLTDAGLIQNINWDVNWSGNLDPRVFSGLFFIKIEGLKVINQHDYILDFPEVEMLSPKNFTRFATANGIVLPDVETVVTIYGRDLDQLQKFKVDSPLIVFEKPSESTVDLANADENTSKITIPTVLKFDYIIDMIYFNETASQRKYLPLFLTYRAKTPFSWRGVLDGLIDIVEDPLGWFEKNWFIPAFLLIFLTFLTLMYSFLRGGGGANINIFNKGSEGA